MTPSWQTPHYVAVAAAGMLAFGAGYLVGGRSAPASAPPPVFNTNNGVVPAGNAQAPRERPNENELIERNAEPEEGSAARQPAGSGAGEGESRPPRETRGEDGGRTSRPSKPPPTEEEETFGTDDE